MTISRQPKGIPVGGQFSPTARAEPGLELVTVSPAVLAAKAAEEASKLSDQRDFQRKQMIATARRHQAIACSAAAHHVLQQHPGAAVLVFEVRDERPYRLSEVFNADGNRVAKRISGAWAEEAVMEVRDDSIYDLAYTDGVDTDGRELRVNIGQALPAAAAVLNEPLQELTRRPLTEDDQRILADAAPDAYNYVSGGLYGDLGALSDEEEAALRKRRDDLGRVLGYDG